MFFSCANYKYVDENKFIGIWELKGRDIYQGMVIKIERKKDKLIGVVVSIPQNKYGTLLMKKGDVWIPNINRVANYYFKITENKIAGKIFPVYNLPASTEYFAYFSEDNNIIYLAQKPPNIPVKATSIFYKKIK